MIFQVLLFALSVFIRQTRLQSLVSYYGNPDAMNRTFISNLVGSQLGELGIQLQSSTIIPQTSNGITFLTSLFTTAKSSTIESLLKNVPFDLGTLGVSICCIHLVVVLVWYSCRYHGNWGGSKHSLQASFSNWACRCLKLLFAVLSLLTISMFIIIILNHIYLSEGMVATENNAQETVTTVEAWFFDLYTALNKSSIFNHQLLLEVTQHTRRLLPTIVLTSYEEFQSSILNFQQILSVYEPTLDNLTDAVGNLSSLTKEGITKSLKLQESFETIYTSYYNLLSPSSFQITTINNTFRTFSKPSNISSILFPFHIPFIQEANYFSTQLASFYATFTLVNKQCQLLSQYMLPVQVGEIMQGLTFLLAKFSQSNFFYSVLNGELSRAVHFANIPDNLGLQAQDWALGTIDSLDRLISKLNDTTANRWRKEVLPYEKSRFILSLLEAVGMLLVCLFGVLGIFLHKRNYTAGIIPFFTILGCLVWIQFAGYFGFSYLVNIICIEMNRLAGENIPLPIYPPVTLSSIVKGCLEGLSIVDIPLTSNGLYLFELILNATSLESAMRNLGLGSILGGNSNVVVSVQQPFQPYLKPLDSLIQLIKNDIPKPTYPTENMAAIADISSNNAVISWGSYGFVVSDISWNETFSNISQAENIISLQLYDSNYSGDELANSINSLNQMISGYNHTFTNFTYNSIIAEYITNSSNVFNASIYTGITSLNSSENQNIENYFYNYTLPIAEFTYLGSIEIGFMQGNLSLIANALTLIEQLNVTVVVENFQEARSLLMTYGRLSHELISSHKGSLASALESLQQGIEYYGNKIWNGMYSAFSSYLVATIQNSFRGIDGLPECQSVASTISANANQFCMTIGISTNTLWLSFLIIGGSTFLWIIVAHKGRKMLKLPKEAKFFPKDDEEIFPLEKEATRLSHRKTQSTTSSQRVLLNRDVLFRM